MACCSTRCPIPKTVTDTLLQASLTRKLCGQLGVSGNILDASYQAVVKGIEYGLLLSFRDT